MHWHRSVSILTRCLLATERNVFNRIPNKSKHETWTLLCKKKCSPIRFLDPSSIDPSSIDPRYWTPYLFGGSLPNDRTLYVKWILNFLFNVQRTIVWKGSSLYTYRYGVQYRGSIDLGSRKNRIGEHFFLQRRVHVSCLDLFGIRLKTFLSVANRHRVRIDTDRCQCIDDRSNR